MLIIITTNLNRLDVYIINYMERMPVAKEDVRELLDVNASNYYAYFRYYYTHYFLSIVIPYHH